MVKNIYCTIKYTCCSFERGDGQVSARDGPDGRDGDEDEYGGDGRGRSGKNR